MVRKAPRAGASAASAASRAAPGAFTSFAAATAAALSDDRGSGTAGREIVSDWDASALSALRVVSKKRDATTRLRALGEILAALGGLDSGCGRGLITAWGAEFGLLVCDADAQVRVAVLGVMGKVVQVFGRRSQTILKAVVGEWVGARGDGAAVVGEAARRSLLDAFGTADVRRKLARGCGEVLGKWCVGAVGEGDEARSRKAIAGAEWLVEASGTLDGVTEFLDDGWLGKAAMGVKGKGKLKAAVPREACGFAAVAVVPLLGDGDEERATRLTRIAESCVVAGEAAGFDLLLALMNKGLWEAFGDWSQVRTAMRSALSARIVAPGALTALLPILVLLPDGEKGVESLVTAKGILDCLREGVCGMPEDAGANRGMRAVFVSAALPAYLECASYVMETGAERWCGPEDAATLMKEVATAHVRPVLELYISGVLFPPAVRRATAGRRGVGERPRPAGAAGDLAQKFARVLLGVRSTAGDDAVRRITDSTVLKAFPLRGPTADVLILRFTSFCGCLVKSPGSGGADTALVMIRKALQATITADSVAFEDLAFISGVSLITLPEGAVFDESDTSANRVSSYALSVLGSEQSSLDMVALVGSILSWTAAASVSSQAYVFNGIESASFASGEDSNGSAGRYGLLSAMIRAHAGRSGVLQCSALDSLTASAAAELLPSSPASPPSSACMSFLEAAVIAEGCELSGSCFANVVSNVESALRQDDYGDASAILRLSGCILASTGSDGGTAELDRLAGVSVSVGVASLVPKGVYTYCSDASNANGSRADDLVDGILSQLLDSIPRRPVALAHAWVSVVNAAMSSAESRRKAHFRAKSVVAAALGNHSVDSCSSFETAVLVKAGPQLVLATEDGLVDPDVFVAAYETSSSHFGLSTPIGEAADAARELLFDDLVSVASAPAIAHAVCKQLLSSTYVNEPRSGSHLGLLSLLEKIVREQYGSGVGENSKVGVEVAKAVSAAALSPAAIEIVSVCSSASGRRILLFFREMLNCALLAIRRGAGDGSETRGLGMICAALCPRASANASKVPDWLFDLSATAIRAVRRSLEASAFGTSRSLAGPGAELAASVLACSCELHEDEWRFWSLASLDCLRETQLVEPEDLSASKLSEMASMSSLALEMVSSSHLGQTTASVDELIYHGAWSGVKLLPTILSNLGFERASGHLGLMAIANSQGVLIRSGQALPVKPGTVYQLVDLLESQESSVRSSVFAVLSAVALDDIPRFIGIALSSADSFSDEESEERGMRDLVPQSLRSSLRWPESAAANSASYSELSFFLSWLLFFNLVKNCGSSGSCQLAPGSDVEAEGELEDRSFRRVALGFLRSDRDMFSSLFSRCVDVVVDGKSIEKVAAASSASSITEGLSHWLHSAESTDDLDVLVGRSAGAAFAHALQLFPALSRQHVADHVDHSQAIRIEDFVRRRVSPLLISEEIRKVREWGNGGGGASGDSEGELNTRGSVAGREVWASYTVSEVSLVIALRLPEAFPLQIVNVEDAEGNSRIGKGLWRKTLLQMNNLLRAKDGSLAEAVGLWRRTLDLRLGGLEDCPVCYCVLHLSNGTLPSVRCGTCSAKYHGACLYKWFTKSSTRSCPMCRSTF